MIFQWFFAFYARSRFQQYDDEDMHEGAEESASLSQAQSPQRGGKKKKVGSDEDQTITSVTIKQMLEMVNSPNSAALAHMIKLVGKITKFDKLPTGCSFVLDDTTGSQLIKYYSNIQNSTLNMDELK